MTLSRSSSSYTGLALPKTVKHLARFTSGIWQIHPFCEGNTRTTAVFIMKYLQTFGFEVENDVFAENSWYFHNALVRTNYNDLKNGVHATPAFLEAFFENMLLGTRHELKNRFLHIGSIQSAEQEDSKSQNGTLNCSLEELAILRIIKAEPGITQKSLAERIGKSERTVKRLTVVLQEKQLLRRVNGKRDGHWEVTAEI